MLHVDGLGHLRTREGEMLIRMRWCICWWGALMSKAKLLGIRILLVFDMTHPDCTTFPLQIRNLFSHYSVIQTIQPVIEVVGGSVCKSASLTLIQSDSKPTGQPARHSVICYSVLQIPIYQPLHSATVGCDTGGRNLHGPPDSRLQETCQSPTSLIG